MEDAQYGELNPRHEGRLKKKKIKFPPPPTKLQPFKKGVRFFAAPTVTAVQCENESNNGTKLSVRLEFLSRDDHVIYGRDIKLSA